MENEKNNKDYFYFVVSVKELEQILKNLKKTGKEKSNTASLRFSEVKGYKGQLKPTEATIKQYDLYGGY